MKNLAAHALAYGESKKPKQAPKKKGKVKGMHIRKADSGGFIARHEEEDGEPGKAAPEHVLPDMEALKAHLEQHLGENKLDGAASQAAEGQPDTDKDGDPQTA